MGLRSSRFSDENVHETMKIHQAYMELTEGEMEGQEILDRAEKLKAALDKINNDMWHSIVVPNQLPANKLDFHGLSVEEVGKRLTNRTNVAITRGYEKFYVVTRQCDDEIMLAVISFAESLKIRHYVSQYNQYCDVFVLKPKRSFAMKFIEIVKSNLVIYVTWILFIALIGKLVSEKD